VLGALLLLRVQTAYADARIERHPSRIISDRCGTRCSQRIVPRAAIALVDRDRSVPVSSHRAYAQIRARSIGARRKMGERLIASLLGPCDSAALCLSLSLSFSMLGRAGPRNHLEEFDPTTLLARHAESSLETRLTDLISHAWNRSAPRHVSARVMAISNLRDETPSAAPLCAIFAQKHGRTSRVVSVSEAISFGSDSLRGLITQR